MGASYVNPANFSNLPDPVLTNLVQDNSNVGGWVAPIMASVKQTSKDFLRWGKQDTQSLLSNLFETMRAPGSRYNLLPRPIRAWVTSVIQEDAVRVEYTDEDVLNSVNPEIPRMDSAMKILNVLQFATEVRVAALYASANFAAANKAAAALAWSAAAGSIQSDVELAKIVVLKRSGIPANYIEVPPSKIPGIYASTEIKNLRLYNPNDILAAGGYPPTLFGLKLIIPGARNDTAPTGTFTPAFIWDDGVVRVGYSPTLDGSAWDGTGQAYAVQFENQINGAAYEVRERLDPDFEENLKHIVFGNVRRSLAEQMNPEVCFAITGV
jgi:hypothetical protein